MLKNNAESELIDFLIEIEAQLPVEEIQYDGVYLWPLIKIKVQQNIWIQLNEDNKTTKSVPLLKKIRQAAINGFNFLLKDIKNHVFLKKSDVLIMADPFNRRVEVDQKKFEIYTDPIVQELNRLNISNLTVERNSLTPYPYPRYTKSLPQILIQWPFMFFALKRYHFDKNSSQILENIALELQKKGYRPDAISTKSLSKYLKVYWAHYKMYQYLFKIVQPKWVILTEWYSTASVACTVAAKKMNIHVVEVQHGVQTSAHIAYGNWLKTNKKLISPFPDTLWVWSAEDKLNIDAEFSKVESRSFLGGNLFLEKFRNSEIKIAGEDTIQNLVKNIEKPICLVTLQPVYELNEALVKFIEQHKGEYYFLLRLHPVMSNDTENLKIQIEKTFNDLQYNIDLATSLPLLVLLKVTNLHLTYNSSVVIEASEFNVPSVVCDTDLAQKYFKSQINSGICSVFNDNIRFKISNNTVDYKSNVEKIERLINTILAG
jgi:hypothetical protein